jgi:hypothetical protein
MTDNDRRLIEDVYVAQVLTLAKSLQSEDSQKGTWTSEDGIGRALKLIDKERSQILFGKP